MNSMLSNDELLEWIHDNMSVALIKIKQLMSTAP
ncbi:Uncharacterised protein [Klebsiella pneumoniae]|nr:Uncharacterised protein [Klebsiella pneumoniae]